MCACGLCVVVVVDDVDVAVMSVNLRDVTAQRFYEQRVAHQTQFIRIHKAMELLLLLCAAAKSAWEALTRAQSAQECWLKVSRRKHRLGWGGATSSKSAKPQSAAPYFSLCLPSLGLSRLQFSSTFLSRTDVKHVHANSSLPRQMFLCRGRVESAGACKSLAPNVGACLL